MLASERDSAYSESCKHCPTQVPSTLGDLNPTQVPSTLGDLNPTQVPSPLGDLNPNQVPSPRGDLNPTQVPSPLGEDQLPPGRCKSHHDMHASCRPKPLSPKALKLPSHAPEPYCPAAARTSMYSIRLRWRRCSAVMFANSSASVFWYSRASRSPIVCENPELRSTEHISECVLVSVAHRCNDDLQTNKSSAPRK